MDDAPPGKSKRHSNNVKAVKETAASSRPKRVIKETDKGTEGIAAKGTTKRSAVSKSATTSKAPAAPNGASKKRKVGRPPKRKIGKAAVNQSVSGGTARKRAKTNKSQAHGKKEDDVDVDVNGEDEEAAAQEDDEDDAGDGKSYWLMKAEPESRIEKGVDVKFSIDDLRQAKEPEAWDARNHMRAMRKGDLAFFYHSNCKVPGIAGTMEIVQEHSIDETAFDPAHPYYDEKSTRDNPKWEVVHVQFKSRFKQLITLAELKSYANPGGALENLQMLKQSRLSVSSVTPKQWKYIMSLAQEEEHNAEWKDAKNQEKSNGANAEDEKEDENKKDDTGN
ncbi:hypothetical protein PRK78_004688 [Emydomyces testavorans]|uniref:Thymocyte nuclear protein 1 n=1 Tax=Emydomyces testavorans TaxID=2070801 RepID=A0AAF0ILX3_9EURO|nr:hypothetical protein PRK78_004688 [Emydomyces testavorans]